MASLVIQVVCGWGDGKFRGGKLVEEGATLLENERAEGALLLVH